MVTPNLPSFTYWLPEFDRLEPDTLPLRAPVIEEAIAVNLTNPQVAAEPVVAVTIAQPTINIARKDGSPLQIMDFIGVRPSRVFLEPVPDVTLRHEETAGMWSVDHAAALKIQDPDALEYFLGLIASFSVDAEGKKQKAAEAARALKLLDTFRD
jgi:hypothetical protein